MTVRLNPYINFRDRTREAMTFYQQVFGGELTMDTFESFGVSDDPAEANKIMHSQLEAEGGLVLMAADLPASMEMSDGSQISLSLSGDDEPTLRGYYDALADGGTVVEPLAKAPWGDYFGMCIDRFGMHWMVNIADASS
ncbi:VOC family protein [Egicoccus sp. AB-alg6-2]|uniref:VOC family protein n=1 Tax=Egicoccus sp. AB-alg6-2 TaxID=3242692 RepID=UPI00359EFACD